MKRLLMFIVIFCLLATMVSARVKTENDFGKAVSGGCIGTLMGLGGFLGCGLLYTSMRGRNTIDYEGLLIALVGGAILYPIGCATGVYYWGNMYNEGGSWGAALGYSYLWELIGIPLLIVPIAGPFLFFMAPVYGALIGYNKNSRDSKTAFINIEDGQLCFGSLAVSFRLNPYDKKDIIKSVDLVAVRF